MMFVELIGRDSVISRTKVSQVYQKLEFPKFVVPLMRCSECPVQMSPGSSAVTL